MPRRGPGGHRDGRADGYLHDRRRRGDATECLVQEHDPVPVGLIDRPGNRTTLGDRGL